MKISGVSVRGYRTIKEELNFNLDKIITLVGPNNSGKTNTLRAVQSFFTGYDNQHDYQFERDICKGEKSLRTNIQLTLSEIDAAEHPEFSDIITQVRELLQVTSGSTQEITLYLTFSPNSNPVYRVFPNIARPKKKSDNVAYSRLERRLFDYILDKFSIHYIPSEKSVGDLYRSLIMPYLFKNMYKVIEPQLDPLDGALSEVANQINAVLEESGLDNLTASFELPKHPSSFFRDVGFNLKDTNTTSVFHKGMGIQSAVLLSGFCWIARQEADDQKLSLWLLEEPESYLHPELAGQCLKLLNNLSGSAQVIVTTHSLGFVPQDPEKVVGIETEEGWTKVSKYKTYHEATGRIRSSLGVRFSDYYNFSEYNILVEGQTDRRYINFVLDKIRNDKLAENFPTLLSASLSVHDYGGVKGIEGFLRATYAFIRNERPSVTILDGDAAGDKARKDLQGFFGSKGIPFQANLDFIIIRDRFAIEGLLPDAWIKELQSEHPSWFEGYAEDASGVILPFKIKDNNKDQYYQLFVKKVNGSNIPEWIDRWEPILTTCEASLLAQKIRIEG